MLSTVSDLSKILKPLHNISWIAPGLLKAPVPVQLGDDSLITTLQSPSPLDLYCLLLSDRANKALDPMSTPGSRDNSRRSYGNHLMLLEIELECHPDCLGLGHMVRVPGLGLGHASVHGAWAT